MLTTLKNLRDLKYLSLKEIVLETMELHNNGMLKHKGCAWEKHAVPLAEASVV